MVHVIYFALGRLTATVSGDVSFNDALQRIAEMSEFQMKYDLFHGPVEQRDLEM